MCLQQIAVVSTKRKFNDVEKEDDENEDEDNKISRLLAEAEQSGISQLDAAGFVTILLYVHVCTVCMYVCNHYCMTWYLCMYVCMYASIYLST